MTLTRAAPLGAFVNRAIRRSCVSLGAARRSAAPRPFVIVTRFDGAGEGNSLGAPASVALGITSRGLSRALGRHTQAGTLRVGPTFDVTEDRE